MKVTRQMCLEFMDGSPIDCSEAVRFLNAVSDDCYVPDWMIEHVTRATNGEYKFHVEHRGEEFWIWAKSAADAKNIIRYNRYGKTPEANLPAFNVTQMYPNIANVVTRHVGSAKPIAQSATPFKINLLKQRLMKFSA